MYLVKTHQDQPARFAVTSKFSLTGYSFIVQTSETDDFTTTFERGQANLVGDRVVVAWSAAEVNEMTDRYFRIEATKANSPTFYLGLGHIEYTPASQEISPTNIDADGYLVEPYVTGLLENNRLATADDLELISQSLNSHYRRYLGEGTTYPGSAVDGDFMYRSDLFCLMRRAGGAWRQMDKPQLANFAAIQALPTLGLHAGFEAWQTDSHRQWRWNGTKWQFIGGNIPAIMIRRTTNFSMVAVAWTPIPWEAVVTDGTTDSSLWSSTVNNTRVTIPFDGLWFAHSAIGFDATAGWKYLAIRKNGTLMFRGPAQNMGNAEMQSSATIKCVAGDYLEALYYSASGGTASQYSSEVAPRFEVRWAGAA